MRRTTHLSDEPKIICGSASAIIPESVHEIGQLAFYGMSTPSVMRIPDHIELVHDLAFTDCDNLFQLIIPAKTKLRSNAFSGCSRLTHVIYEPGNVYVKTKNRLSFNYNPFKLCRNLVNICIDGENMPIMECGFFKE